MKSFSKVLSVLVLSLFCSFFVGMDVKADNTVGEVYYMAPFESPSSSVEVYFDRYFVSSDSINVTSGSSYRSYPLLFDHFGAFDSSPAYGFFSRVVADTVDGEVYVVNGSTYMNSGSVTTTASGSLHTSSTVSSNYTVGSFTIHFVDTYYLWCRPSNSESAFLVGSYSADGSVNDFEFEFISSGGDVTLYFYLSGSDSSYDVSLSVLDNFVFSRSFIWYGSFVSAANRTSYPYASQKNLYSFFSVPVFVNDLTYQIKKEWTENDPYLEQMKQTNDLLTNFPGSSDMDASKGQLDTAISDYDQIEGSLFDSGQTAFDQFDPSSVLTFSAGIYAAIAALSNLMIQVIAAMGEFSVIYTIGVTLVFIGMLIGLWRFFK